MSLKEIECVGWFNQFPFFSLRLLCPIPRISTTLVNTFYLESKYNECSQKRQQICHEPFVNISKIPNLSGSQFNRILV